MESIGFKEWAMVCQALGRGEQCILIRKGGIAEGRDGFSFRHREFFLFPTWFHEQPSKVRKIDIEIPPQHSDKIDIEFFAKAEEVRVITSWKIAEALAPLHIFQPEVVRERFDYDAAPGLHVAFVRAFRLQPSWTLPNEKRFAGCRSWIDLPTAPNNLRFDPVLGDDEHARRREDFVRLVG